MDEADDFFLACRTEEFPPDYVVVKAFGILHFISAFDRQRLFRLYCQLVNRLGVGEEELREAWRQNKLKEFLLFRGSQIPCIGIRSETYWLSQHTGFGANTVSDFTKTFESGRHFLSDEDQKLPYHRLQPREKLEAYVFYCQFLNGYLPDVEEDNWIFLGFCAAKDNNDNKRLAYLYAGLTHRCQFEEFWKAMATSTMIDLFRKYGFGPAVSELRNFETLMCKVGKWHESAWNLKRFTRLSNQAPIRAVIVDYGFCNCQTPQERLALKGLYTDFFAQGGDEMALHEACIQGQLASFLESELGEIPFTSELLWNPYPLERCGHMGMVLESTFLCPESIADKMKNLPEESDKERLITLPDEYGDDTLKFMEERATFLRQRMRVRTTVVDGMTLKSLSGP